MYVTQSYRAEPLLIFFTTCTGHGYEDFSGVCYFKLSDHSESIHKKLEKIKDNMNQIRIGTGPILEGLEELWEKLTSWLPNFCMFKATLCNLYYLNHFACHNVCCNEMCIMAL